MGSAQSAHDVADPTQYVPASARSILYDDSREAVVLYDNWPDLAKKLAKQPGKPYQLSLILDKNTPADWQALRRIPPATNLSLQLADSVMSDSLLPILATWPTLNELTIRDAAVFRSYTIVTTSTGERKQIGPPAIVKQYATTGWDKLKHVETLMLFDEIGRSNLLTVVQSLPALRALTIQNFRFDQEKPNNVPAALAGFRRLRKLVVWGHVDAWQFATVFAGLSELEELQLTEPNVPDFNAALPFLTKLKSLKITCSMPDQLRLGRLPALQTLTLTGTFGAGRSGFTQATMFSLDPALAGLTTLRSLSLNQIKLANFPIDLLKNRQLTHLLLSDAGLTTLPEGIDQLQDLVELNLTSNPLHYLPDALGRLRKLRSLSLGQCELDSLPDSIGGLTKLLQLTLTTNQLKRLPATMGQLRELQQLNVSMNQLTALPDELGTLPKLETIAAFWNQISRFPVGFGNLLNLYLSDNQLTELPNTLGTFKRLRTLVLDNNPLTYLPEAIGQLDSLETLTLGNNQLTALPNALGTLPRLSRFTLGTNQVRTLPDRIGGLSSLTFVAISDNPIAQLPRSVGGWAKVRTVQLTLPQLETLPPQIGQWQALKSLTIDSDRLLVLPEQLTDCQKLTDLSVTGNRLLGLPEAIGKLTWLGTLRVAGRTNPQTEQGAGQVVALPAGLANCTALTELTVMHQAQFDGVDLLQTAVTFPALSKLSLINCGLTDLGNIPWQSLRVKSLNLSKNRISQLPASFIDMPDIQQINLSETNLPTYLNRYFAVRMALTEAIKAANR